MVLKKEKKFRINDKFTQSLHDNLDDSEFDVKYPKKLPSLHNDLLFLSERRKI